MIFQTSNRSGYNRLAKYRKYKLWMVHISHLLLMDLCDWIISMKSDETMVYVGAYW